MAKKRFSRLGKKIRGVTSDVISLPSRSRSKRRGQVADSQRKAVRFLRSTKGIAPDPKTRIGRDILEAQAKKSTIKKPKKKKKK